MSFLRGAIDESKLDDIEYQKNKLKQDMTQMQRLGSLNDEQKTRLKAEYRDLCRRESELKNK